MRPLEDYLSKGAFLFLRYGHLFELLVAHGVSLHKLANADTKSHSRNVDTCRYSDVQLSERIWVELNFETRSARVSQTR